MEQDRYGTWVYKKMTDNSRYQELADCIRTEQLSAAQIQEEIAVVENQLRRRDQEPLKL